MREMSIRQAVKGFILSNFLFAEDESVLGDAQSLVKSGVIDSTGVLELILHLEKTYAITVGEDEMVPENFDSVNNIVAFVERKRSSG